MAKMIPAFIDSSVVESSAERRIFEWFKENPYTKSWIVLHSLGIAEHTKNAKGEVDFLVIAPGYGTFALEAKAGRVRRENGVWIFTSKDGSEHPKPYGPFAQANDGIHSLKNYLIKKVGKDNKVAKTLFGSGVMFPDVYFENNDPDCFQEQIFDSRFNGDVSRFIRELSKREMANLNAKGIYPKLPTEEDAEKILEVFRKDYDFAVELSLKINRSKKNLLKLTKDQFRCVDGLRYNERCLINGPAGTGKTILAIKHAKECCFNNEKVALFCYNLLLEKELQRHFDDSDKAPSYIGSITNFLEKLIIKHKLISKEEIQDIESFYEEEIFVYGTEAIEKEGIKFDKIIVDEAQDIIKDNFLLILDQMLVGGLKEGKWFLFGDYNSQNIYNKGNNLETTIEKLKKESQFAIFQLTKNCRNTIYIQEEMNKIANLKGETLNKNKDAPLVNYVLCNENNEASLIEKQIESLINQRIKKSQITILSPFKVSKSSVNKVEKYQVKNYEPGCTEITFSTIQSFKGLENDIIFLTDIHTYSRVDLTYVGMSRAKVILYVFENEYARNKRIQLEKEKVLNS